MLSFSCHWHEPTAESTDEGWVTVTEPFPASAYMQLDVEMQFFRLEHALLRVNLLKSLMENLCYKQGIYPSFEYHLDEDPD